jgi:hypothetical protein
MTVYNQGKQIVVANIDAQLDVLLSASGRVLLAFQDEETRQARIQESRRASPRYDDPQIGETLRGRAIAALPPKPYRRVSELPVGANSSQSRTSTTLTPTSTLEYICDVVAEANQIAPRLVLRCLAITCDDGTDECRVCGPHIAWQTAATEGHPEKEVTAVPICLANPGAQGRTGEFVQLLVAATIALPELDEAGVRVVRQACSGRQRGAQTSELIRFSGRATLSGEASDYTLSGAKYFIEVRYFGWHRADDPTADLRQYFQEPLDRQTPDRIADRRAAYREYPADPFGRKLIAGIQSPAEQESLEVGVGQVMQAGGAPPQRFRSIGQNDVECCFHG